MDYPNFTVSIQKEEPISKQRVFKKKLFPHYILI